MKVNRTNLLQQWAMNFFFGDAKSKPVANKKVRTVKNEDTFVISKRRVIPRIVRSAEIEMMIKSGEPMRGVTYEEFCDYLYDTQGGVIYYGARQGYRQALKGDNASLREREWRTNPKYQIPIRLYDSPEVTADREAAIEKYRRGEELCLWEKHVMHTFVNGDEMISVMKPAELDRKAALLQKDLSAALSGAGIQLGEEDEITFEVWGKSLKISGNIDEDTINAMYKALSDNNMNGRHFQGLYFLAHENEARTSDLALGFLRSAEDYLLDEGSGVTVFDLSLDEKRNVIGLPKSLDEQIKKYAVGEFGESISADYSNDSVTKILKTRYIRESFRSAIETVQKGDYDRLKALTCKVTYENGVLSC